MRRTILDQPEIRHRPPAEKDLSGILVFALVATSAILVASMATRLPPFKSWRLDFDNTGQTIGQAAFILTLLCPLSLFATRRWYAVIGDSVLLIMLLIGVYSWLNSIGMILAIKFWAEPQHADLNHSKLEHLPFAIGAYLLLHVYLGYLYWRQKRSGINIENV